VPPELRDVQELTSRRGLCWLLVRGHRTVRLSDHIAECQQRMSLRLTLPAVLFYPSVFPPVVSA
jgi:hypothetical protein